MSSSAAGSLLSLGASGRGRLPHRSALLPSLLGTGLLRLTPENNSALSPDPAALPGMGTPTASGKHAHSPHLRGPRAPGLPGSRLLRGPTLERPEAGLSYSCTSRPGAHGPTLALLTQAWPWSLTTLATHISPKPTSRVQTLPMVQGASQASESKLSYQAGAAPQDLKPHPQTSMLPECIWGTIRVTPPTFPAFPVAGKPKRNISNRSELEAECKILRPHCSARCSLELSPRYSLSFTFHVSRSILG